MLANVLILAAEEAEGGGADLLLPPLPELIAGITAFAIVFFFMWRFAWPQLQELLDGRQREIAGRFEEADSTKQEAQTLLEDYKAQVANAKAEANQMIEEARVQAETVRAEILDRAKAEADAIVAKAREEAELEKERALVEARQEVANLSIDLAERVVGSSLDREAQKNLVEQYLAELERMSK